MTLRWEKQPNNSYEIWYAYSGNLVVGTVGDRDDGSIWWRLDGVHMKWIAKSYEDDATSIASAKRAVWRSWRIWLRKAGLGGGTIHSDERIALLEDAIEYAKNAEAAYEADVTLMKTFKAEYRDETDAFIKRCEEALQKLGVK